MEEGKPMNRAYAVLEIKSLNDDARTFTGIASTPSTDRQGDIVEPKGAQYKLPIPLLWQHRSGDPVGQITSAKVTTNGIEVSGQFAKVDEPPSLKDDLDRAWAMVKAKLVRGLSIGFNPLEFAQIKDGFGLRYTSWEWLELSAVTIPANQDASIQTIKSIDNSLLRAASGAETVGKPGQPSPGASGSVNLIPKGNKMPTNSENIQNSENKRAANVARMQEIMTKQAEEGRTPDVAENEEYDTLEGEVKSIDEYLVRLKRLATMTKGSAAPVAGSGSTAEVTTQNAEVAVRPAYGTSVRMGKSSLPPGVAFARYAMALAVSKGNIGQAANLAARWKDSSPEVENVLKFASNMGGTDFVQQKMQGGEDADIRIKTAIAAGTTQDTTWASPLVQYTNMASEFVALLYPMTILGKMQGLRKVPFNIRFPTQTAGATVGWVGEGASKPVSKLAFTTTTLGFAKAAGIVVITQELARFSSPSAEMLVRDDLLSTIAQFQDVQFISPGVAAVANVNPASITNGITAVQSGGVTRALLDADVASLLAGMLTANIPLQSLVWVMTPYEAMKLSMLREVNGEFSYPDININGGTWQGIPVIVSNNVPSSVSAGSLIILVAQNEIFYANDGGVQLDASEQASLQMDSAPTNNGTSPTPTTLVSLWQDNLIGIRAEIIVNWARRRAAGVAFIDNVHL